MNHHNPPKIFVFLLAVSLSITACNPSGPGVTTLWPDVPPFPGATADVETNAFFNGHESAMVSIQYFTDKQPADIADFYSYSMMHAQGWDTPDVKEMKFFDQGLQGGGPEDQVGTISGCWADVYHDKPRAGCWFNRVDSTNHDIELTISADPDQNSSRTVIIYTRTTGSLLATPTP